MSQNLRRVAFTALLLLIFTPVLNAADSSEEEGGSIDLMGKVLNHDYVELPGGYNLYLPQIYYVDGDLYFYGNTKSALESSEFVENSDGAMIRADGTPITINLSISSHLVYVWLGFILTFIITVWAARRYKSGLGRETEPKGTMQNIFEVIFVFIRDEIAKEFIPEEKYKKFVPYLFTVFMAITFMNLFGLLPWAASATADITVTATLAGITFLMTQWNGTKDHWQHVFVFPGVPAWSRIILTPVEILGLFTKPFALAIRLFANMLSGKIMIISILGLIFIFTDIFGAAVGAGSSIFWVPLTAALYFLKALVAFIQAYVFTLLSGVFIGMAAEEHAHEHEETSVAHAQDVEI
ncbi:MAG: F0F1 ATP synthase subunit A [Bacteroidetes bacterium]|jgi:F-type H+-transporting ATPase subunit a|nr:F0F1 ATP synthase subunit A [Bacteroidota bacterium]